MLEKIKYSVYILICVAGFIYANEKMLERRIQAENRAKAQCLSSPNNSWNSKHGCTYRS